MTMAISAYDCTKPGTTPLDELQRALNDVVRLAIAAGRIAESWGDANRLWPGDGAGAVSTADGLQTHVYEGETRESISQKRNVVRQQVRGWWAEWNPSRSRLSRALRIKVPDHLHIDLGPTNSAVGRLDNLFLPPLFLLPGEEAGDHLIRSAAVMGLDRTGGSNFPHEAVSPLLATLTNTISTLGPLVRDGYEWPGAVKGVTKTELLEATATYGKLISASTFDRIRTDAGVAPAPSGGAGPSHLFKRHEVELMIASVSKGKCKEKKQIIAAWTIVLQRFDVDLS